MTPISSTAYSKLFFFFLITLVASAAVVGLLPLVVCGFALFMADRHKSFEFINLAAKIINAALALAFVLSGVLLAWMAFRYATVDASSYAARYVFDEFMVAVIICLLVGVYYFCARLLFFGPLAEHAHWIDENGIFKRALKRPRPEKQPEVGIVTGVKDGRLSVADELLKWANLYEDGHISAEDFESAKSRLLKRS